MILVRLCGGMGNQMYQYAFARALGLRTGAELRLDLSYIRQFDEKNGVDSYALQYLSIESGQANFTNGCLRPALNNGRLFRGLSRLDEALCGGEKHIVIEQKCEFNPARKSLSSRFIYVYSGTFQSFRYFDDFEPAIRREFRFSKTVKVSCTRNADLLGSLPNTVSVHIRRGDYVGKKETEYTQGICTPEYYAKAIAIMEEKLDDPQFVFFSDDIQFVKETFGLAPNHHYLNTDMAKSDKIGHRDTGFIDMYLMSLCSHHIIANSTFSWWAAYLNERHDKIIIAPARWYRDIKDSMDILPESWIKI